MSDGSLSTQREALLGRSLVELADTLVDDFRAVDYLYLLCARCVEALEVDEVGVLLADPQGVLELSAASSEQMDLLELFEMQQAEGPCYDAFVTGEAVAHSDITDDVAMERWPRFAPRAAEIGFRSVFGFPLRLRTDVIGALNLFRYEAGPFAGDDVIAGRTMADMAAVGVMQERAVRSAELRAEQLQHARDGRVIVEQAKGALVERLGISAEEAFTRMRHHARTERLQLTDVCAATIEGDLTPGGRCSVSADRGEPERP